MNKIQRKNKVKRLYDRADKLTLENKLYRKQVNRFVLDSIEDDASKDLTTRKFTRRRQKVKARITSKAPGILAGMEELVWICKKLNIKFQNSLKDGAVLQPGSIIAEYVGNARIVLASERTLVDMLQRMSGISTATARMRQLAGSYPVVAATRKTLWGGLDKKAVAMGGGMTHRLGLYDGVMVKDNHKVLLADYSDLKRIFFKRRLMKCIEVESFAELKKLLETDPRYDVILLDNFNPAQIKRALNWASKNKYRNKYLFETSGNIDETSIKKFASTDVDVISIGSLTHSAQALDISLKIIS